MDAAKDKVEVIQSESKRLNQYLSTLPLDTLGRPSAVDGWEIGDVVAHLVFGSGRYTGFITRGLEGDTSPPEGLWDPGATAASGAARIDQASSALREKLGDQLIPTFHETSGKLSQLLAGLSSSDLETPCYHLVLGVVPIRETLKWWITELGMHSLDIRSVLEPEARLSPDTLPGFMEFMPDVVRWSFRGNPEGGRAICYRVELTGPEPSRSDIIVDGDRAAMKPAGSAPADVTFRCDAETFTLLMYGRGRLSFDEALADGRLVMEGERELVTKFADWFPGA